MPIIVDKEKKKKKIFFIYTDPFNDIYFSHFIHVKMKILKQSAFVKLSLFKSYYV